MTISRNCDDIELIGWLRYNLFDSTFVDNHWPVLELTGMVAKVKVHETYNSKVNPAGEPWIIEVTMFLDPKTTSFLVVKSFYLNII